MEQQELEPMITAALAAYSPSDAVIAAMRDKYMPLRVQDEDDKAGHTQVRAARLVVKEHRVNVEKKRKELKEGALRYGQAVDAEAKRLTAALTPIEDHLQAQEDIVAKAAERRRIEEERMLAARVAARMAELSKVEHYMNPTLVATMGDEEFAGVIAEAGFALAERREAQRLESERLKNERLELERVKAEHGRRVAAERAETERVRAEHDRKVAAENLALATKIAAERAEAERIRAEGEAKLAAERAALDAERMEVRRLADIKAAEERALAEAEAKRQREEADRARREAMRPVNEKLTALAERVRGLEVPEFDGADEVRQQLGRTAPCHTLLF